MPARVGQRAGGDRAAAREMRQVRPDAAARARAADGVAEGALAREEDRAAARGFFARRLARRTALRVEPPLEIGIRLGDDVERHVRVLASAEFRALPAVDTRPVRLQPDGARDAGDEIALALQVRRPEAVDDVVRRELEQDGAADRNVNLVRGLQPAARRRVLVLDFPPPLMAG